MNHDRAAELLGAYCVNALEASEVDGVEDHLLDCGPCREETEEYQQALAMLTPEQLPPEKLLEELRNKLVGAPPPLTLAPAPSSRNRRALAAAAGVGVIAAMLSGILALQFIDLERRFDQMAVAASTGTIEGAAQAAQLDPGSQTVVLKSADVPETMAELVILRNGAGYLVDDKLDPTSVEFTYQLWSLKGRSKISVSVLGPDPEVSAFRFSQGVDGFAITEEQAPGVEVTKQQPLVVGWIAGR